METQHIYLSGDESEIVPPCSSLSPQLPNTVLDTYSAIRQLIAAEHEQMSSRRNLAQQYPPTLPNSLMSDNDDNEVFTPLFGNVLYTPNCCPHPLQVCQQLTPMPGTPESPTPENHAQPELFRHYDLQENPTTSAYPLPSVSRVIEGLQDMI